MDFLEQLIKEYDLKILRDSKVLSLDELKKMIICKNESDLNEKRCDFILSSGVRCKKAKVNCNHPKQFLKVCPVFLEDDE